MIEAVRVDLGDRGYDILVGSGLIADAGRLMAERLASRRTILVTDEEVAPLHAPALARSLAAAGFEAKPPVVLPAGEATKSFAHLQDLVEALLDRGIERSTVVVALGGGVIGDITGFAAAVALRGVDLVQVPTTLLAQVDSAVGGKTGINTRHGKNLVGAFHQPRLVLADMRVLETLPRRQMLAGYAEVVKYGLIGDAALFAWLEENGPALIAGDEVLRRRAVAASCRAKAAIVGADEREAGARALLNLGHTFAHALEAECAYDGTLLHGEAVAIGLVLAFELSARLGLSPADDARRVRRHLAAVGLPTGLADRPQRRWDAGALLAHMRRDKKVRDGQITFVLARGLGRAFIADGIAPADVLAVLEEAMVP